MGQVVVHGVAGAEVLLVAVEPERALHVDLVERHARRPRLLSVVADARPAVLGRQRVHGRGALVEGGAVAALEHLRDEDLRHGLREARELDLDGVDVPELRAHGGGEERAGAVEVDELPEPGQKALLLEQRHLRLVSLLVKHCLSFSFLVHALVQCSSFGILIPFLPRKTRKSAEGQEGQAQPKPNLPPTESVADYTISRPRAGLGFVLTLIADGREI